MDITTLIASAILLEGIVEYGKTIADTYQGGEKRTAIIQLITVIGGIIFAYALNLNMFVPLGIAVNHYIGVFITGIIISRGSNYVSDLIGRMKQKTVG